MLRFQSLSPACWCGQVGDIAAMEGPPVEGNPPGTLLSPAMRVSSRARRSPCWVSDFVITARMPQFHEPQYYPPPQPAPAGPLFTEAAHNTEAASGETPLSNGVPAGPRAAPASAPVSSCLVLGQKRGRDEHKQDNPRLRAALLQCVDRLLSLDETRAFRLPPLDSLEETPALQELLARVVGGVYDDGLEGVCGVWECVCVLCASGGMAEIGAEAQHTATLLTQAAHNILQEVELVVVSEGTQEKEKEKHAIPPTHIDLSEWDPGCPLGERLIPQWHDTPLGEGVVQGDWEEHAYMSLAIRRAIAAADVRGGGEGEEERALLSVTTREGQRGQGREEEEGMWEIVRQVPARQAQERACRGSEAGCARLQGYEWRQQGKRRRRRDERPPQPTPGLTTARILRTHTEEERVMPEEEEGGEVIDSHPVMALSQIRRCGVRASEVVRVGVSTIHGLGVFARAHIPKDAFVLEYMGELIRHGPMADKREDTYHQARLPDYQFRVDGEWVVDGTRRGNVARLLNHSCNPNVRAASLPSATRIVLIALRDISAGEELCYDYKFPEERRKLPCHCGASNCRGFLN